MIVYLITNKINNKRYVGITIRSIQERFLQHSTPNTKNKSAINDAIKKYGKENFDVVQLDTACSLEELKQKEIYWIEKLGTFQCEYNLTKGGDGMLGYKFKDSSKEKIKKSCIERMKNENVRKHLSEKTKQYFQNHPEQKLIISRQQKERAAAGISKETCEKISKALFGKKKNWSSDGKARIGKSASERMKKSRTESFKLKMKTTMTEKNPMNDPKNRELVRLSKIGKKRVYREDGSFYMSHPNNLADHK